MAGARVDHAAAAKKTADTARHFPGFVQLLARQAAGLADVSLGLLSAVGAVAIGFGLSIGAVAFGAIAVGAVASGFVAAVSSLRP